MDPRPYHFQYRRPRLSNPTYQSSHLYESVYQLNQNYRHQPKAQPNPQNRQSKSSAELIQPRRSNSTDLTSKKLIDLPGINSYRYSSRTDSQPKSKTVLEMAQGGSKLSNYGSNLLSNTMDQRQIYQKQQKEFNIINLHPRRYKANLKQFPRLTLEDKIIDWERKKQNV